MTVYRPEHFAKATDGCNVTQPTLNSMIQRLEDKLDVKVFDHKRQPIQPTQAGMKVVEGAWKMLNRTKRLKQVIDEERQVPTGTFEMGALPAIAPYLIPRFFPQLMSEHPEMNMRITEMRIKDMHKVLHRGDIDADILAHVDELEEMSCTSFYHEQFFGYVAKGGPLFEKGFIRPANLSGEYLWLLDEGHYFRDQLVEFCQLKSAALSKKSYSLGSIETFMRIVEEGEGVTFVPQLVLSQLTTEQHRLVHPFVHPVPSREIILMTSPNFIRHTLLHTPAERVKESLPDDLQN